MGVTANFKAWAAQRFTMKVHTVEFKVKRLAADAYGPAGTLTIRITDYAGRWDGANWYTALLAGIPSVTFKATEVLTGLVTPGYGSMELAMPGPGVIAPGTCQTWESLKGSNYLWQGQEFTARVGGLDLPWADWAVILTGYLGAPTFTRGRGQIPLLSKAEKVLRTRLPLTALDAVDEWQSSHIYTAGAFVYPTNPAHQGVYNYLCTVGGTSGAAEPVWPETPGQTVVDGTVTWQCSEFPAQNLGKPRPLLYGRGLNISPLFATKSPSRLYLKHDFWVGLKGFPQYDTLYMDGLSIPKTVGGTSIWRTVDAVPWQGFVIELLQEPKGAVTVDAWGVGMTSGEPGASEPDAPVTFLGDIAAHILYLATGDMSVFTALRTGLNSAFTGAPFTLYIDSWTDIQAALDTLMAGLPALWGVRRNGDWFGKRLTPPSGTPDLVLTERDILDIEVEHDPEIYWSVTIRGEKNHTPMTNPPETIEGWHDTPMTDLRRDWLHEPWREGVAEDKSILATYPLAQAAGPHETCLGVRAGCATVAGIWLTLRRVQRKYVRPVTKLQGLTVETGDEVHVTHAGQGLNLWRGIHLGSQDDHNSNRIQLNLWG